MEQSPDDPVCVIKIDVNCCKACPRNLNKVLSKVEGVYDVVYDPQTKLAFIKGKFDPFVLMKTIGKLGKKSELISYNKHHILHTAPDQQNAAASGPYKDEGKTKVGPNEKNQDSDEFVSRKDQKYHKPEACVPPKGTDEAICKDRFCKIHTRSGSIRDIVTNEARERAFSTFGQLLHFYHRLSSYGRGAGYPPYHPSMLPPEYGAVYPPTWHMPGIMMNDYTSNPNNDNPRNCNTM